MSVAEFWIVNALAASDARSPVFFEYAPYANILRPPANGSNTFVSVNAVEALTLPVVYGQKTAYL